MHQANILGPNGRPPTLDRVPAFDSQPIGNFLVNFPTLPSPYRLLSAFSLTLETRTIMYPFFLWSSCFPLQYMCIRRYE
jgi:hypothetical protein